MKRDDEFLGLMMRTQKELSVFVGSMVWDRHACDDIMQELALTMWRQFDAYDRSRPFGAWGRGICLNLVRAYYARRKREGVIFSEEALTAIGVAYDQTPAVDPSHEEALRGCLSLLPDESRDLLKLRYEEALSLKELSGRLSKSWNAVNMLLSRLRAKLLSCVRRKLELAEEQS